MALDQTLLQVRVTRSVVLDQKVLQAQAKTVSRLTFELSSNFRFVFGTVQVFPLDVPLILVQDIILNLALDMTLARA